MLRPLLNRQARGLTAVSDMLGRLGRVQEAVAVARSALQRSVDMGELNIHQTDYDSHIQTRILCLRTLSESLSSLKDDVSVAESVVFIQNAVNIAEMVYQQSAVETTRKAVLLVECLVSLLRKVPEASLVLRLIQRIREICKTNALPIEPRLEQILQRQERKSSGTAVSAT